MDGTGRSPRRERIVGGAILATMLGLFAYALFIFVLPFAFPTPPPIITRFQSTVVFSPNDDGRRDVALINVRVNEPGQVLLDIVSGGETVTTLTGDQRRPRGWLRVRWDGRDDAGEVVADGEYGIRLRARSGDKRFNTSRKITIDTTAPSIARLRVVSATLDDPGRGECRVTATAADPGSLLLRVLRPGGTEVLAHRGPSPAAAGRAVRWRWDGRGDDGRPVAAGLHVVQATLRDAAGNRSGREATCWVGRIAGEARPAGSGPRAAL
ncbi:MAG: FlgD immunoglobulin-like domain containing protein, partial [Miltoncostaeaceae bacterium]